ncbi:PREDICTED: dnaJ-like protein 1 [Fragaria vesca subsp. vesca]|uniref:dnaJ-like protein 1 n=1 Tax=Fragaria vesca subsp. vesca TaxID=101020 RepID=UPI0002C303D9|nr:PREDICTED: dnaJ-like protein 1 [Fragaria vesca subsp. vesca]
MVLIDHYKVLDLPSGAEGAELTEQEITKRYKAKALLLHPDKRPGYPLAGAEFQQLKESYEVLKDPKSREKFHVSLRLDQITYGEVFVWATGLTCLVVGGLAAAGAVCVVNGTCSLVKNVCVGTADSIGSACDSVIKVIRYKEPENNIEEWEMI